MLLELYISVLENKPEKLILKSLLQLYFVFQGRTQLHMVKAGVEAAC